jgi:hypothetical protein
MGSGGFTFLRRTRIICEESLSVTIDSRDAEVSKRNTLVECKSLGKKNRVVVGSTRFARHD